MPTVKTDIEIAREAKMKPIMAIGKALGIPEKDLIPYGHTKAKVGLDYIDSLSAAAKVKYYDFENSHAFTVRDFKNDDHLNSNGARKFSLMVDSILMQPLTAEALFPAAYPAALPAE